MSDGNLSTWRSVTHERAHLIGLSIGWLLVCLAVGAGLGLIAYDLVLQ